MAAAIARFEAEVAAPSAAGVQVESPWQRAALVEGVGAKQVVQDAQGGARWLS